MWILLAIFAFAYVVPLCATAPSCPIDGPLFPKLAQLSENGRVKAAVENLTASFELWDADISKSGGLNYSYSVEIFSASEAQPLFSRSYTSPTLATQNSSGVSTVNSNTVFRLGSLTKVFTIYTFLINAGDLQWNEPITKFVPELAALAERSDSISYTAWNDVTIGSLATQMSGLPRDYALLGELLQTKEVMDYVVDLGFPPLSEEEKPHCGAHPLCSREQFFAGIADFKPSFAPFQSPAYSNVGYQLLAYALESITGKSFQTLLEDTVLKPLNLTNTFLETPDASLGVIPRNISESNWAFSLGEANAAGNMYSSAADITTFGRAILSHRLLPPAITRRWLKPFAFSSDPKALVGAPWGARRISLGKYQQITAFNKAGRLGDYSSVLAIIPEDDIGFSVLLAGDIPGNGNFALVDFMGEYLVPAIQEAAREAADAMYGGRYVSADGLNSSLTIGTDDGPGLSVTQWFSNGTDFRLVSVSLAVQTFPSSPSIRMYPTGLEHVDEDGGGGKKVAFKTVSADLDAPAQEDKMFSTDCGGWVNIGSVIYGSELVETFIFHVDSSGKATSVELPALRITLNKEQD